MEASPLESRSETRPNCGVGVKRCFDLKGSKLGRETKMKDEELIAGTGMKVLKEENLLHLNALSSYLFDINPQTK